MFIKILIILLLAGILASLCSGLFYLVKDERSSKRMARALTVRITLSVALFVLLFVAHFLGLLQPHGVTLQ